MASKWSQLQSDIFTFAAESRDNFIINAVAGSGKTTTAIELAKRLGLGRTFFLAFNKAIATELELRGVVNASTFHSAGFAAVKKKFRGVRVDTSKLSKLAKSAIPKDRHDLYLFIVQQIIAFLKQLCVRPEELTHAMVISVISHNDMDVDAAVDTYALFKHVRAIFLSSVSDTETVDFDDMLYFPWYYASPLDLLPNVIIDEAQDTNRLQRELLLEASHERLIAIGDPYQSIYGFRGADSDAIHALAREFSCQSLPLSVCYRCARAIISEAQKYVPHITAADGAEEGAVIRNGKFHRDMNALICRYNAPLVRAFFNLTKSGISAHMLGRALEKPLIRVLKSLGDTQTSISVLFANLERWSEKEIAALSARQQSITQHFDRYDCLCTILIATELDYPKATLQDVLKTCDTLFDASSSAKAVTLSTIHKAKGLEWKYVGILESFFHHEISQPWQQPQEENLKYVAITRAKHELTYIDAPKGER